MSQWQNTVHIGDLLRHAEGLTASPPDAEAKQFAATLKQRLESLKPLTFAPNGVPWVSEAEKAGLTEELDTIIDDLDLVFDQEELNLQLERLYDLGDTHLWGSPLGGGKLLFVDTLHGPDGQG